MDLSFSYLLTIFVNLNQQPLENEIKITNQQEKFISFLNDTYLFEDYPNLKIQYSSDYTSKNLEIIEDSILHYNTTVEFKTIHLSYVYLNKKIESKKLDIVTKDINKLYDILYTMYCLIKGYKIEETVDSLIIITPTNNRRTIQYNQNWYCDCKTYNNYNNCEHIKIASLYLNHRTIFNKPI